MEDKCANTKCKWHRRDGGGCKLFEGRSWEACRKSVKPGAKPAGNPPAKIKTAKGQAK